MINKAKNKSLCSVVVLTLATGMLSACAAQTTPTMMNMSPVEIAHETILEQIPLANINDKTLSILAQQYHQYGSGVIDLTMAYDPKAKNFTAMKAVHELKRVQLTLNKKGVRDIVAQTLPVPDGQPSLMVSFSIARAQAPSDCGEMPGLKNNKTSRFLGDYKFGCGIESILAQQIARPSDLEGKSEMGMRSGRREAIILDGYSSGVPREPLEGVERADLASGG